MIDSPAKLALALSKHPRDLEILDGLLKKTSDVLHGDLGTGVKEEIEIAILQYESGFDSLGEYYLDRASNLINSVAHLKPSMRATACRNNSSSLFIQAR